MRMTGMAHKAVQREHREDRPARSRRYPESVRTSGMPASAAIEALRKVAVGQANPVAMTHVAQDRQEIPAQVRIDPDQHVRLPEERLSRSVAPN